jgi:hypothetical protein
MEAKPHENCGHCIPTRNAANSALHSMPYTGISAGIAP